MNATPREFRDEFAERVKLARENAGFTQETMARLLHISQPTYSKYEGGRGNDPASMLPHRMMLDFCDICRVSVEWLLSGEQRGASAAPFSFRPRRKATRVAS